MITQDLLVLLVPQSRRNDVIDLLIEYAAVDGFTVAAAAGFSREHADLELREQVQGYRAMERFEIVCDGESRRQLLQRFGTMAGRDRFHYWVVPLQDEGSIGGGAAAP
jgi:hypothetical protein